MIIAADIVLNYFSFRVSSVRLSSFPNYASAEMSVSESLLELGIKLSEIQPDEKGSKVTKFPLFPECRNVGELSIVRTKNGGE
jgi:hypothetical protein